MNTTNKPKRNTQTRNKHRQQIKAQQLPCHLCGQPIDYTIPYRNPDGTINPNAFVVDHINPISRSHDDTITNKAAAHQRCNLQKGDRTQSTTPQKHSKTLKLPN